MTRTGKTLGILASHARQAGRATLTSHLFNECEPIAEFLDRVPRRSPGPALKPDQSKRRPTDNLQNFVVELTVQRGDRISVLWQITLTARGM